MGKMENYSREHGFGLYHESDLGQKSFLHGRKS